MANASTIQSHRGFSGIVKGKVFDTTIMILIVINAVILGLETSSTFRNIAGGWLETVNFLFVAIFVVELLLRMSAYGRDFWRDGWNWFDVIVVSISLLPSAGGLSALRALRVMRVLRLISVFPSMRGVVEGLIRAIPGMGSITALLCLIFYVFSVMATKLYGTSNPEQFGTLGASAYTLFQVMTLEGWSDGVVRPLMEQHPTAWLFFIPFILVTSFAVLNLFIGVIVESMQASEQEMLEDFEDIAEREADDVIRELRALRDDVNLLRSELEQDRRSTAPRAE